MVVEVEGAFHARACPGGILHRHRSSHTLASDRNPWGAMAIDREEIERRIAELGLRLKQVRLQRRITQQQLADRLNVSVQLIGKLEQGRGGSLESLHSVAVALDVRLGLLGGSEAEASGAMARISAIGTAAMGRTSDGHDKITRLARRYPRLAPVQLIGEARLVRERAYAQLECERPCTSAAQELHSVAGQASGLLAVAAFDLRMWDVAEEQSRGARAAAEIVGDAALRSWAVGTQALTAFWSGRPRRALQLVGASLDDAPEGAATARLLAIQARAWALLGHRDGVLDALRQADAAMEADRGTDPLFHGVGGEFSWGHSRHAACAGTALLMVGDTDGAARRTRSALKLRSGDPYGVAVPRRAYIDLAAAELGNRRLDAASAALSRVWSIPVAQRRHALTARLERIAALLATPEWCRHQSASLLRDRIEVFVAEALVQRTLPSL